jgi:hypothetical protein
MIIHLELGHILMERLVSDLNHYLDKELEADSKYTPTHDLYLITHQDSNAQVYTSNMSTLWLHSLYWI